MRKVFLLFLSLFFIVSNNSSSAEINNIKRPFGVYCPNGKRGLYGERCEVRDLNSAMEILKKFYEKNDDVKIGEIIEKKGFFEAHIYNKEGILIDILIIHKKSGRIRSIY